MKVLVEKIREELKSTIDKKDGNRAIVLEMVIKYLSQNSEEFLQEWNSKII